VSPQRLKPTLRTSPVIAAVNRCATQRQTQDRLCETNDGVKRSGPFLHYPYKWTTSRCMAISHSLGSQLGNSRLRSNKVPEPNGEAAPALCAQSSPEVSDQKLQNRGCRSSQCALPASSRRPDDFAAGTRF
jgi:hypothetical protein